MIRFFLRRVDSPYTLRGEIRRYAQRASRTVKSALSAFASSTPMRSPGYVWDDPWYEKL